MSSSSRRQGSLAGRLIIAASLLFAPASLSGQSESADTMDIEGFVVTATAVPVALESLGSHVTVLRGEDLRARGVYRMTQALRSVPGVSVVENGSMGSVSSVFMRGGESDYVQVLIDGVQVNQPGGAFDFSGLDMASVERIEVVRGPSSALNGSDAVAGVIHIITRGGSPDERATLLTRAGTYGRLDGTLNVTGGGENAQYGVTLARYSTDGILAFNNAFDNTVLNGNASFRLDSGTRVSVRARAGDRRFRFPTNFAGVAEDQNQFSFADESSLSAEIDQRLGESTSLRILATSYSVDSGTDDAPDGAADNVGFFGFQSLDSYRRTAVDLRVNTEVAPGVTVSAGGEYESQGVRSFNESLSEFGASSGRSANTRINRAGYLHATGSRGAVSGNAGLRYEDNELFGGFLTWQLGASVNATEALRLRASAGRGIKEPTFFETFAAGFALGNPELEPEVSTAFEAGAELAATDNLTLQATFFRQDFTDLIQFTGAPPVPGGPNYFNVAEARAQGLEADARFQMTSWSVSADLTWLSTEVIDSGFDSGAGASFVEGERLLRRPEITAGFTVDATLTPAFSASGAFRYFGERDDRNFNTFPAAAVTLDAYTRVDASVVWTIQDAVAGKPGLRLTGAAQNLFDTEFVEVFGFEAPGQIFTIAGELTFAR